jgi:3-oxoacyl-[acyl-carrier protein] reductase
MTKVILITGASRGLGLAMAQHYLAAGWIVAGCSRRSSALSHSNYTHYLLDVADEHAAVGMVRDVARRHEGIDALINNAGIALMNHALLTPLASFERVLRTNVLGAFVFSREVAKVMLAHKKSGRIVNLVSVASPMALEGESAYAASKAAVENFTRVLARELGAKGITVNAVGPTPIETDLIKGVPPAKLEALQARQAIARRGSEDDVLNVIDFFLSERSDFITGQIVYLGGIS